MQFDLSALSGLLSVLEKIPAKTSFAVGVAAFFILEVNEIDAFGAGLSRGWFVAQVAMIGGLCFTVVALFSSFASLLIDRFRKKKANQQVEFAGMYQRVHAMKGRLKRALSVRRKIPGTLFDKECSFELHAIYDWLRRNGVSTPLLDPRRGHIKINLHLEYLDSIAPLLTNLGEAQKISREMEDVVPLKSFIQKLNPRSP